MVEYTEKQFKSAMNVLKYIDSWFWIRYTLNGYNGCQIGCIYCDSRSEKYHLPLQFEQNIVVKKDLSSLLERQIIRQRLLPDVVGMSGASDPYQAVERIYRNTRAALKVLEKYNFPVHIITKSTKVEQDLKLINNIGRNTWATVSFTITSMDDKVSKFLEGGAPYPQQRMEMIQRIKDEYPFIHTGVLLMPVVPYLTDSSENLKALYQAAKSVSADYLQFSPGMTLRERQAKWFLLKIQESYPSLIPKYEELYEFSMKGLVEGKKYDGNYTPSVAYIKCIGKELDQLRNSYKLPSEISRYLPGDYRKPNYLIAEELLRIAKELQYTQGRPKSVWGPWFWTGHTIQNLSDSIFSFMTHSSIDLVTINPKHQASTQDLTIIETMGKIIEKKDLKPDNTPLDHWF